jgi:NADH-quinone oxidoreductase subunit M
MFAGTGVIFAAVYLLWMIQRVFFGKLTNDKNKKLSDLSFREIGLLAPLLFLMVFMGVYPRPFLDAAKDSVNAIQKRVMHQAGGDVDHAERNADFSPQAVSKEAN